MTGRHGMEYTNQQFCNSNHLMQIQHPQVPRQSFAFVRCNDSIDGCIAGAWDVQI